MIGFLRVDDGRQCALYHSKEKAAGGRNIADMCVRNPIAQPVARLYSSFPQWRPLLN
jgi:hypothetical protein